MILVSTCLLLAVAVVGVVTALSRLNPEPTPVQRCSAQLDGTNWFLSPDQAQHAALFAAMAAERGLPARAVTIAIATALQESRMTNIDYGDRDSIGLFQQRPSQGWGTIEEIMEPVYSTGKFYDGLVRVPGYQELEITVAAQAVQRSGFPDAYAQHESRSRAWASALTGHTLGAITCTLTDPAQAPGAQAPTAALLARITRDFPSLTPEPQESAPAAGPSVRVDVSTLPGASGDGRTRQGTAFAHWAVAVAHEQNMVTVEVAGMVWSRASGAWEPTENALAPGVVVLRLAAGQQ